MPLYRPDSGTFAETYAASTPATAGLGPLEQMVHRAEVVRYPGLTAVADQQHVHLAELSAAARAGDRAPVDRRWLVELARLPVRALDRPRHHVLEPTERRPSRAGGLKEAKAVVVGDSGPAPGAYVGGQRIMFHVRWPRSG